MKSFLLGILLLSSLIALAASEDTQEETLISPETPSQESNNDQISLTSSLFWGGFLSSIIMIIVSELGDKTFFIAAIMAMRHPRQLVFCAAVAALAVMTIFSSLIGVAAKVIPQDITHLLAAALFAIFGVKLLYDGREMEVGAPSGELAEVEDELEKKRDDSLVNDMEAGNDAHNHGSSSTKIFSAIFMMTFLAEWGDRSQIATIALAADKDPFGVTIGGFIGHSLCTGLAVIGGKLLATRISERTVTLMGGCLFLVFAVHSIIYGGAEIS